MGNHHSVISLDSRRSVDRVVLPPHPTTADVVHLAIADGTARLLRHDPGARVGDDEHIHQARVATRRLRSDLHTFGEVLHRDWVRDVRAELKWVAAALGAVRDADVLLDRLRAQVSELGPDDASALAALLGRLDAERRHARARLREALDAPRYAALLDRLVEACAAPPWAPAASDLGVTTRAGRTPPRWIGSKPAARVVPGLVRRPWHRLEKAVGDAGGQPTDRALHEIRKRAKRCRYACEVASVVAGRPARRTAKAVAALQDVLGELQDGVVAEEWLRSHAGDVKDEAFAAGLLAAVQHTAMDRSRSTWRPAWEAAAAKKQRRWM